MFFLLGLTVFGVEHDVPLGLFTLYEEDNEIYLDVNLDAIHLGQELNIASAQLTETDLKDYINKHSVWEFDQIPKKLEFVNYRWKLDHVQVKFVLKDVDCEVEQISIYNSCLNSIKNHSNIVQVRLCGKETDYRMHKDRKLIKVKF